MSGQHNPIAVTGATGLIGLRVVTQLRLRGYMVRALSRTSSTSIPGVVQIQGDIRDDNVLCKLLDGCHSVIHLAGIAHTALNSTRLEREAESINVGGTARLLSSALKQGVLRVLLVSSAHVYKGQAGMNLSEDSPVAADSFYARTKLEIERLGLDTAAQGQTEIVIVRPCLTYGPGVRFNLHALMRAIRGGYYFHIIGHNPTRSFLSVDNAAAAMVHLLEDGESGHTYNLADREPQSLSCFTNLLAEFLEAPHPRSLPAFPLHAVARLTSPLRLIGLHSPISAESIHKLTASFSLDVSALARTAFTWRGDEQDTLRSMASCFMRQVSR